MQLIVIGQREQCSKHIKPLECNIKPTMVNCYWPARAMQQTHKTSSAVNCYWPARAMQQTLDPIVIGQQEQCSKHIKPQVQLIVIGQREQCSKHMKPLECNINPMQYQAYHG